MLLGSIGIVLAGVIEHPILRFLQVMLGLGALLLGIQLVDEHAILVDGRWLETRTLPLTLLRHRIARRACIAIDVAVTSSRCFVRALTSDGEQRRLDVVRASQGARRTSAIARRAQHPRTSGELRGAQ